MKNTTIKSSPFSLTVCSMLLFFLAGCSWREQETTPTPIPTLAITLPTPLPTLPPTATLVPTATSEPTATPRPTPTLAPTVEPTATPMAVLTSTSILTTTGGVTTTTAVTAPAALTATNAVTTTGDVTTTEELTTTDMLTATETLTAAATLTTTAGLTTTAIPTTTVVPRVFFRQPTANAILPLTSTVIIGVEGLVVEPAGGSTPGAGHLHLLIDRDFIEPGMAVPKDESHLHLGDGALEKTMTLTPGEHTLRLQFTDGAHLALEGEQYQAEIAVFVLDGAPAQAVRFVQPSAGAVLSSTVEVIMAASGLIIEPAGEIQDNAGHLHILIDSDFTAPGDAIPKDEAHLHFGQGQITTTLELPPGEHTLRLQFANGAHIALAGEQYRDEIEVTSK